MAEPRRCLVCKTELVTIAMTVDGNVLDMESCETCDVRSWSLGGAPIDLELVLQQVGEHAGRRH
ncbi:MAG: hypothetical protein ACI8TP_000921 [Acidimicrobiales bacterium]|jgi:hypothetical protein